jgi:signal transduction histidine kinase
MSCVIGPAKPILFIARIVTEPATSYRARVGFERITGMHIIFQKTGFDRTTLERLLNFLPYPFLLADTREGVVINVFANRAFREEIGFSIEEIPTIEDWFTRAYPDPQYRSTVASGWATRLKEAREQNLESVAMPALIRTAAHGDQWYEVRSSVSGPVQFIAFVNIHQEILREQELQRLSENQNQVLSILSHDLRSPLHNLHSVVDLVLHNELTEKEKDQSLTLLNQQLFQITESLETTLQWARQNFEAVSPTYQEVNVSELVQKIIDFYSGVIKEKDLQVEKLVEPGLNFVTDPGILTVAIRNIFSNAIKFTPRGRSITIGVEPRPLKAVLMIRNEGSRLTPDQISSILGRNYNSTPGTAGEKGLGLGLKLTQAVLKKLEGVIEMESDKTGTSVRIVLPNA